MKYDEIDIYNPILFYKEKKGTIIKSIFLEEWEEERKIRTRNITRLGDNESLNFYGKIWDEIWERDRNKLEETHIK
jgi:hypothetical protein